MQIKKIYQNLMFAGIDAKYILTSKKGLKVTIVRKFDNTYEADEWFKKRELYMQRAFQNLEVLCHNVKLLKKNK
jgi:hypothetical protein